MRASKRIAAHSSSGSGRNSSERVCAGANTISVDRRERSPPGGGAPTPAAAVVAPTSPSPAARSRRSRPRGRPRGRARSSPARRPRAGTRPTPAIVANTRPPSTAHRASRSRRSNDASSGSRSRPRRSTVATTSGLDGGRDPEPEGQVERAAADQVGRGGRHEDAGGQRPPPAPRGEPERARRRCRRPATTSLPGRRPASCRATPPRLTTTAQRRSTATGSPTRPRRRDRHGCSLGWGHAGVGEDRAVLRRVGLWS